LCCWLELLSKEKICDPFSENGYDGLTKLYEEFQTPMSSTKLEILQQLHSLLSYHKGSGLCTYPRSEEVMAFLRSELSLQTPMEETTDKLQPKRPAGKVDVRPSSYRGTIAEIAEEVNTCRACSLAEKRIIPVAGRGGSKQIRLFVVGGWLMADGKTETVFGREEDLMLERMLQAIHLSADQTFVSNIIKCGIDQDVQPKAENIDACVSYLERQIAAASPEIICSMGIAATRTLLQISQPLSRLRGRFYTYHLDEHREIPLIPTYHPTFLLKNPEMKKATWEDLQLIEKHLRR